MSIHDDLAKRNRILREMDVAAFRRACPGISPEAVLPAMHKARYEIASMAPELRHASRAWLEQNGYGRYQGGPWPPAGVLEE